MTLRKLEPQFHERVWGVRTLAPYFSQPASSSNQNPIGEVWFQTEEIPLLVKFLFTTQNLSVQVHPEDEYATKHHNSLGKTEMWQVLAAEPDAKIAAGFCKPITREHAHEAALSGEIEQLLEWHDATAGDTFYIPAGTVHAIGAGLTICEIQQLSDITYRLYDYGRMGLDGRPRPLHLEHGLAVSRLEPFAARTPLPVRKEYFITEFVEHEVPASDKPQMVMALAGSGFIGDTAMRAGEVVLIPAGSGATAITGALKLMRTLVP
jgi:mannose-6-phosphate isomerase